jgi:small subunit ribosomal protein S16
MLTLRLQRIGKKGQPSYRLVVAERRSKMAAPPTEDLGAYNPFTKQATFKSERVQYWIGVGASPTVTVHNLLVKNGVVDAPKKKVYMKQPVAKVEEPEVAKTEAPAVEAAPADAPAAEAEEKPTEEQAAPAEEAAVPAEAAPEEAPAEKEKEKEEETPASQ